MRICQHRPPCGDSIAKWICGARTVAEQSVKDGRLTMLECESLLAKYGVPMSKIFRVYKGEAPQQQPRLL